MSIPFVKRYPFPGASPNPTKNVGCFSCSLFPKSGDVWEKAYVTDSRDCRIGLVEL